MFTKRRVLIACIVLLLIPLIDLLGLFLHSWLPRQHPQHEPSPDVPVQRIRREGGAVKEAQSILPQMIGYRETAGFAVPFRVPRAMAVDSQDRIYVAGDRGMAVFSSNGGKLSEIALNDEPHCLAIGSAAH